MHITNNKNKGNATHRERELGPTHPSTCRSSLKENNMHIHLPINRHSHSITTPHHTTQQTKARPRTAVIPPYCCSHRISCHIPSRFMVLSVSIIRSIHIHNVHGWLSSGKFGGPRNDPLSIGSSVRNELRNSFQNQMDHYLEMAIW